MANDAVIILDPVNRAVIDGALDRGLKDFIGGNCTVSLMLMAMDGLFRADLVEWMTSMTYQAASGGGAKHMRELVAQWAWPRIGGRPACRFQLVDTDIDRALISTAARRVVSGRELRLPARQPARLDRRRSRQRSEPRGVEGRRPRATRSWAGVGPDSIDGICVRIGSMRCHSQALTVKLRRDAPLEQIERLLAGANEWVKVVPNEKNATLRERRRPP